MGHLLAAIYALKVFEFDEVWLVPVFRHRFEKKMSPFPDRVRMCRLLIQGITPKLKVSTFEGDQKTSGRTLETLTLLRRKNPSHYFSLVLGSDLWRRRKNWYRFGQIEERFGVTVVPRGKGDQKFGIPDISSTEIKRRISKGRSANDLLTADVAAYVERHGLYRSSQA